jgi:hypothetical protein
MHVYKNISEEQKGCTRCCFTCFVLCEEKVSECTFPSFWEFRISCVWRHMSEGMRLPILIPIIKQIGPVWLGLKDDTIGTTLPFTLHGHTRYSHAFRLPSSPCKAHFTHETESPWPLHFKHSHWWKRRVRSKFASHYAWGTTGACECSMDVKSTWIPTWHPMDHASWSLGLFSINLLEVGLTQKRETMELRRLTIVDLFYFIMCEDPHE